jgi:predicted transcriptional regulator
MVTTTIRIEDELKERIATAAARSGKTAHAFMLDAIARSVEQAEQDEDMRRLAEHRWSRLVATGKSVPWEEARSWLQQAADGAAAPTPTPRKPRR